MFLAVGQGRVPGQGNVFSVSLKATLICGAEHSIGLFIMNRQVMFKPFLLAYAYQMFSGLICLVITLERVCGARKSGSIQSQRNSIRLLVYQQSTWDLRKLLTLVSVQDLDNKTGLQIQGLPRSHKGVVLEPPCHVKCVCGQHPPQNPFFCSLFCFTLFKKKNFVLFFLNTILKAKHDVKRERTVN